MPGRRPRPSKLDERSTMGHPSLDEEQEQARARMAESGEEPIPMTVALLAFESPHGAEKQP